MEAKSITPVQAGERINEIDIIRGVALLGILIVNMSFYKYHVYMERIPTKYSEGIEQLSAWFIQLFFTGNFYAVFSFLFGLGFFIFMDRTLQKGLELMPLYSRRLKALMAFGILHLVLFWSGDILLTYSITGFILLAFRRKSLQAIKKWIYGLFITACVFNIIASLLKGAAKVIAIEEYRAIMEEMISTAIFMYTEAGFFELVAYRLINEIPYVIFSTLLWIPQVLAFFLCGLYAGKLGLFKNIPAHISLFKKLRSWGFLIGGFFLLLLVLFGSGALPVHPLLRISLFSVMNYIASIFIFPAYVASLILAAQADFWKKVLSPIAAAGKMALTNYLSQTLICVFIFYGFGFGLYGKVSIAEGLLITIAIYLVQVAWSNAWLQKFQYGPMEWFWRLLTYKKRQPLMKR